MFHTKKQSKAVTGNDESCQTDHIAAPQATWSSPPFMKTVYFIDHKGKLKPLTAEVDTGSFCTVINHEFLADNLLNKPMDPLKDFICTYSHQPIHAMLGTVDLHACLTDQAVSMRVYFGGLACLPLVSRDLIDGFELSIHWRDCLPGLGTAKHMPHWSAKHLG